MSGNTFNLIFFSNPWQSFRFVFWRDLMSFYVKKISNKNNINDAPLTTRDYLMSKKLMHLLLKQQKKVLLQIYMLDKLSNFLQKRFS